jgi:DtxR family Mn-dependent transcriptional regulator
MSQQGLSASLEDYLEVIFHVVEEKGAARPKDIARELGIGNSSVTAALKTLAAKDLVNYAPYDVVTLTASGELAARDVVHRHETLREFFIRVLAADEHLANRAACQLEHAVPGELVERFIRFLEFIEMCPKGGPGLLDGFRVHLEAGCRPDCFDNCPASSPKLGDRRAEELKE